MLMTESGTDDVTNHKIQENRHLLQCLTSYIVKDKRYSEKQFIKY